MLEEIIILLLFFLSLLFPTAFNTVFQFCMVKFLRSAGWNDAATELNFLNKKVLVVFLSVSLYAAVLCVAVKELLCNGLGIMLLRSY